MKKFIRPLIKTTLVPMKSEEGRGSRAENKMGRSLKTDDRDFENTGWEGRRKRRNISMLVEFVSFPDMVSENTRLTKQYIYSI